MQQHRERAWTPVDLDVHVVDSGRRPTVVVRGDVDLSNVGQLTAALEKAMGMGGGSGIELDFGETTFMSSAGITALLAAHVRLGQIPEAIVLCDVSPAVRRVLDFAGVTHLFTVRPADSTPSPIAPA